MKKKYEAPVAEAVKFEYRDQVVAASGCTYVHKLVDKDGDGICDDQTPTYGAIGCQAN